MKKTKGQILYEKYKKTKKKTLIVYFVLRLLIIIISLRQIFLGNIGNFLLCLLSLFLFTIPDFIENKLKIELPGVLESIIYLFIFSAEILGEISNFYGLIPLWDTMLHTLNGFICAGIGLSLVELLNDRSVNINLSPFYITLVAFCFSMTIGVLWEFVEYSADRFLHWDMQKDTIVDTISTVKLNDNDKNEVMIIKNINKTIIVLDNNEEIVVDGGYLDIGLYDTMKDLLVNLIGALVFSLFGYFYLINKDKNEKTFVKNFIPRRKLD